VSDQGTKGDTLDYLLALSHSVWGHRFEAGLFPEAVSDQGTHGATVDRLLALSQSTGVPRS